ncbi:MAG: DNA polymerase III subunit delta', partial [Candidatus Karelsulcia muelleri]
YYGASIIHINTLHPLKKKKIQIPLYVRSFFFPKKKGTLIKKKKQINFKNSFFILKKKTILLSFFIKNIKKNFLEKNISEIFISKIKILLIQYSSISFTVCLEDKFNNIMNIILNLKNKFIIKKINNVELYTIIHYKKYNEKNFVKNKKILLRQMNFDTAQWVLKIDTIQSKQIALKAEGNLNKALKLVNNLQENYLEINFISWIRNLFFIKNNPFFLEKIILFSKKINFWKKETQIKFLLYLIEIFRKAFIQKYNNFLIKEIPLTYNKFNWTNFCLFIHKNKQNIEQINIEINKAIYEIEKNAVVEIVFLDLSLKINELFKK